MISVPKKVKYSFGFIGILLLLTLVIAEWRFNAVRTSPHIYRNTLTQDANVVIVVQPEKAPHFVQSLVREVSGYSVPMWILRASMPHEFGVALLEDEATGVVDISVYGSLKRFGIAVVSMDALSSLSALENRIDWEPDGLSSPQRGVLLGTASIISDVDALDQIFLQWGEPGLLVPKSISGDHFWELMFDNRAGKAYLSMASMMTAFDYKFSKENMDILLSSIQFVVMLRAYADVSEDDVMSISIDMDIIPAARNRVGVLNMKGAIDEGFTELGKRLVESHGIQVEGGSDWNEMTIEFRYTIDQATQFVGHYFLDDGGADG